MSCQLPVGSRQPPGNWQPTTGNCLMDQILIILIALTAAAVAWALVSVIAAFTGGEKRKIHQRLSTEHRAETSVRGGHAVLLHAQDQSLPSLLRGFAPAQILQRRINQAFPELRLTKFLTIVVMLAVSVGGIAWLLSATQAVGIIAGAVGGYLPFFVISARRSKRQKTISRQLPEALDFLSRVLRAGQSFSTGLQMMSE